MINLDSLNQEITKRYPVHPFTGLENSIRQLKPLLGNYLAMSQAFPYLQSGSQKELVFHFIAQSGDIPRHVELTTVVGNFLAWDETGGFYTLLRKGLPGLPQILNVEQFHANILKKDLERIFGSQVPPIYSLWTKKYLHDLYRGLASFDPVERVAMMVSFEVHAQQMILALWESLHKVTGLNKDELIYFSVHVGGDDPAEAYHVAMTQKLMDQVIEDNNKEFFMQKFVEGYGLHTNWCAGIVESNAEEVG